MDSFDLERGESLLVAVSGGSDSIAMLELVSLLRDEFAYSMTAAYVDHGVRDDTDQDIRLVTAAAARTGAGFELLRLAKDGGRDEAQLREQRYNALQQLASRQGHTRICTGHTEDDQIETILLRFLRGAGRLGLGGIPAVRGNIVRPLIDLNRAGLRDFLAVRGVRWCEDPTNAMPHYTRNRLRNTVIPVLRDSFGEASLKNLPSHAEQWAAEDAYLEDQAERWRRFAAAGERLDLIALADLPEALRNRVLRRWLQERGMEGPVETSHLRELKRMTRQHEGSGELSLPGVIVVREYSSLRVVPPSGEPGSDEPYRLTVGLEENSTVDAPDGSWSIEFEPCPSGPCAVASSPYSQEIDLDRNALEECVVLRPIYKGESLPDAAPGSGRKVQDVMTDLRIERRRRGSWPVLEAGERAIWIPGLGVASDVLARETTGSRVRLRWNCHEEPCCRSA